MTIASEITRLQWAKSDIKTSIENKGVAVPSSTKLDDYAPYIDQINTWAIMMSWLTLRNVRVSWKDGSPHNYGQVSWTQGGFYYWCSVFSLEWSAANSLAYALYTYRKVDNNDLQYTYNESGGVSSGIYTWVIKNTSFWKNWTKLCAYFFVDTSRSSNWITLWKAEWDYTTTGSATVSQIASGTSYNLSDYGVDLTGYTEVTTSEWVTSANGNEIDDDAYIYLTLK